MYVYEHFTVCHTPAMSTFVHYMHADTGCISDDGGAPEMRNGWLQHLRSSIMVLSMLGAVDLLVKKLKFFSKMAR